MVSCYSCPSPLPVSLKCTKNGFQVTKQETASALSGGWAGLEVSCLIGEQEPLLAPVDHTYYYFSKNTFNVQTDM